MKKQGMGGSAFLWEWGGWVCRLVGCADRLRTCMKKNTIQLSFGLL